MHAHTTTCFIECLSSGQFSTNAADAIYIYLDQAWSFTTSPTPDELPSRCPREEKSSCAGSAHLLSSCAHDNIVAYQVVEECGDIPMAIVQNKVDLIERAVMSSEEAEAMARRLNLRLYRSCVKEDLNVASGEAMCLKLRHAWSVSA